MAHYRKPIAAAVVLNSAIFIVEAIAGFGANSLSLIMDSAHNLSDELALVFIYLAFILSQGVSRNLLRTANIFNSVGLVAVSGVLLWQSVERLLNPAPVMGSVAIVVGLAAAAANWGVARLLWAPGQNNAAIRLAYIHNIRRCLRLACPGACWHSRYCLGIFVLRSLDRRWNCVVAYRIDASRSHWLARRTHLAREDRVWTLRPR
jgi:Co/Zn/Cd efflux system component